MSYTVKQLAKLSRTSVRALHWYDKIGLLKPAFTGDNSYRYYEEEQLLTLQQILFFKELGFSLEQIQEILESDDFDKIEALKSHKQVLKSNLEQTNLLIQTIDKTISHLKGETKMEDQEMYYGFDSQKQKDYESFIANRYGLKGEELLEQSQKRTEFWKKKNWADVKEEGDRIYKAIENCIEQKLPTDSDTTQDLINQHHQMISRFYDASKEVYIGLADLYCEHPDFKKYYDAHHPKMAEYLSEGMVVFAEKNLG